MDTRNMRLGRSNGVPMTEVYLLPAAAAKEIGKKRFNRVTGADTLEFRCCWPVSRGMISVTEGRQQLRSSIRITVRWDANTWKQGLVPT